MPMAGRTHGQHAVPATFGYKVAVWIDELLRHVERLQQLAPRLFVDLYDAAVKGETDRVAELQSKLQHLKNIYQGGEYAAGTIRGIKGALKILGVCSGRMAEPHRGSPTSREAARPPRPSWAERTRS